MTSLRKTWLIIIGVLGAPYITSKPPREISKILRLCCCCCIDPRSEDKLSDSDDHDLETHLPTTYEQALLGSGQNNTAVELRTVTDDHQKSNLTSAAHSSTHFGPSNKPIQQNQATSTDPRAIASDTDEYDKIPEYIPPKKPKSARKRTPNPQPPQAWWAFWK